MIYRLILLSAVVLALASASARGATNTMTPQQQLDAYAMLAGFSLKEMSLAQSEIIALDLDDRSAAVQMAGGALNQKFEFLLSSFVSEGRASREESILAMSLALMKLSHLAQTVGLHEASRCHLQESRVLARLARGESIEPANCRNNLYTADQQASALATAYSSKGKSLRELTNRWATKATMFGLNGAKADLLAKRIEDEG